MHVVPLNLDELTQAGVNLDPVKQLIRSLDREAMRGLALHALELPGAAEIRVLLRRELQGQAV